MKPRDDLSIKFLRSRFVVVNDDLLYADGAGKGLCAGSRAGTMRKGYRTVMIGGHEYAAHRIIWALRHGEWPKADIDHRAGETTKNGVDDLRDATRAQNIANSKLSSANTTGYKGVSRTGSGKFGAWIGGDGKRNYIGSFCVAEDAARAYDAAAIKRYGEFARLNFRTETST